MSVFRRFRLPITLAVLALLGWGAVQLLTSERSLRFAADQLRDRLEDELGLQLEVGELQADAQEARFTVAPVILKDTTGEILFQAQRVSVEVEPLPFFTQRVELRSLEIVDPKLHVRVRDGRIIGLKARAKQPKKKSAPLRVDAQNLRITGGKVIVEVDDRAELRLSGIRARLKSTGEDGHRLKFHVESGEVERRLANRTDLVQTESFDGRLAVFGDGLLAPERVSVSDITLASEQASLSLAGNILLGDLRLTPAIDLDVNAVARLPEVVAHANPDLEVSGAASVAARVSTGFGGKDLRATGQADVTDLVINGFSLGTLRGRFDVDKEGLRVPAASMYAAGTVVEGDVDLRFDDNLSFSTTLAGKGAEFYDIMAMLKQDGAWTSMLIDGEVVGAGTLRPVHFAGTGKGVLTDFRLATRDVRTVPDEDLMFKTQLPVDAAVDIDFVPERIRFEGRIEDGLTDVEGFAEIHFGPDGGPVIEAVSQRADWASVGNRIGKLEFQGVGSGDVKVSGGFKDILIESNAVMRGFELSGFAFGDLEGKVRFNRGVLGILDVSATKGQSFYTGDVDLDFKKQVTLRADPEDAASDQVARQGLHIAMKIDVTDAQAEDLRAVIPASRDSGVLGFVRELDLEGPIRGPLAASGFIDGGTVSYLTGEGALEIGNGASLYGQALDGGRAKMMLGEDEFFLDGMNLEVAGGRAYIDATVNRWTAALTGRFKLDDLELARLDALKGTERAFTGTASAEGELGNVASNPAFRGAGKVRAAAWGDVPIGDATLNLDHADRSLSLTGPMLGGRGNGEIIVETRAPFPYTASILLTEGDLAPLLPPKLLPEGAQVRAGGTVDAFGRLKGFRDSRGTLTLTNARARFKTLDLAANGDVLAHFRGPRVTVDQLEMSSARGDAVRMRGVVGSDELDLNISARGDIGWAPAFFRRVDTASGQFNVDLAIAGDLDRAAMTGTGRVSRGRLTLDRFEHVVRDLDARFVFRGPDVVIEGAEARVGGGEARVRGTITLNGVSPEGYDLKLDYERLDLHIPSWLATRSSGELRLRGDAALPTLSGEVKLHEALYDEDINWERLLPDLRGKIDAPLVFDKSEEDMRFDVHLVADDNIAVRNNVLDVEAKGDLFLVGTEERPGLRGNVSLLGGTATFRNNRYRVSGGNVEFVDSYRVAPVFNIAAETRVKDYDINARILGPLSDVRVELGSTPQLAEIDILALLTFGFTQIELSDDTTTTGIATGLEVVSAYTGLEDEVRRILPGAVSDIAGFNVNELRLTSQFSTSSGVNVPAVAVGFELDPRIALLGGSHLRLQSTLIDVAGNGTEQRVEWEKRFDNDLRLRFVWKSQDRGACPNCLNDFGDPGLDLWYRWEF